MFKVMTIFGTRPETIKMAPVVKELAAREEIRSIVCVTPAPADAGSGFLKLLKLHLIMI